MFSLLVPTIVTSAADSLNPVAIAQQFALQGLVKKPRDIWYYMLPIGLTNFLGGVLAYFGLVNILGRLFQQLSLQYHGVLLGAEVLLGGIFLWLAVRSLREKPVTVTAETAEQPKKIKQVTPKALVLLGVAATISELVTAVPYFAFLALVFQTSLSTAELLVLLVIYNFIYIAPLIGMYLVYVKAQARFDRLYLVIQSKILRFSRVLTPLIFLLLAIGLWGHSLWQIL